MSKKETKEMFLPYLGLIDFRCFEGLNQFNLAPLTILTGPNNSGKSSLIKAILFLKEIFKDQDFPMPHIDYQSGNHNLDSFENTLNWKKQPKNIDVDSETSLIEPFFGFLFVLPEKFFANDLFLDISFYRYYFDFNFLIREKRNKLTSIIQVSCCRGEFDDSTGYLDVSINVKEILRCIHDKNKITFKDPELLRLKSPFGHLLDFTSFEIKHNNEIYHINDLNGFEIEIVHTQAISYGRLRGRKNILTVEEFIKGLVNNEFQILKEDFEGYIGHKILWEEYQQIYKQLNFGRFIDEVIIPVIRNYETLINKFKLDLIFHLPAPTAINERVILDKTFTSSLKDLENENYNDIFSELYTYLKIWLKEFEIGKFIEFKSIARGYQFLIQRNDRKVDLIDQGSGISKLLSLIINVGIHAIETQYTIGLKTKLFLIEEPELHLHPMLQSRLADFIVYCMNKFEVNFIVETHSEYLVRKLQYLIASKTNIAKQIRTKEDDNRKRNAALDKKMEIENAKDDFDVTDYFYKMHDIHRELNLNDLILENKDLLIYYFYQEETKETFTHTKIKEIKIKEDGSLTDNFGPGFFDESINLKIELLKIKNQSKN